MTRTRSRRAVLVAVVAAAALGACGSDAPAARERSAGGEVAVGGTGRGTAVRNQAAAYARCMREHGVDFPDPTFDGNGRPQFESSGVSGAAGATADAVDGAREACESTWPGMEGRYPRSPEELRRMRTALLAFASCMRGQGIDFPDPTFDREGRPVLRHAPEAGTDHGATFHRAAESCRDAMGGRPTMGGDGSR